MHKIETNLKIKKEQAAILLGTGFTIKATAATVGISERQIYRWKNEIAFMDVAHGYQNQSSAERLRIAHQMVREIIKAEIPTKKDLLDWLKYARDESELIDYSNPDLGIPPDQLYRFLNKATRESLKLKGMADL